MSWALAILRFGRSAGATVLGGAKRHPWEFALVAALALAWWQWNGKNDALSERDAAKTALMTEKHGREADRAEWNRKVAAANAATAAAEHKSQEIAHDAQDAHDTLLADNAGLRDYIATHRVRAGESAGPAALTPQGDGAAVSGQAAAGSLVAIAESDIGACDTDYAYARSAYNWAQGLIGGGLAEPGK